MCDIHNYADDNTPSCWGDSEHEVVNKLEIVTSLMMDWFQSNYLQPNPLQPEYMKDLVKKSITRNTKRLSFQFVVLFVMGTTRLNASLWNGLSYTIKQESVLCIFRKLLSKRNSLKCSCSVCKLCSLKYM